MVRGGQLSDELEVKVPAAEAWKLYGSLQLAQVVVQALPSLITKIDVVQGDGSAGTILQLFFGPGLPLTNYKEKFTVVDDEKRVKETEVVEGGYLDLGFSLYRVRFEVVEKQQQGSSDIGECITKFTLEYELKDDTDPEAVKQLVSTQALRQVIEAAAHHLLQNHHQ